MFIKLVVLEFGDDLVGGRVGELFLLKGLALEGELCVSHSLLELDLALL